MVNELPQAVQLKNLMDGFTDSFVPQLLHLNDVFFILKGTVFTLTSVTKSSDRLKNFQ